jgi:peroxiredoxin
VAALAIGGVGIALIIAVAVALGLGQNAGPGRPGPTTVGPGQLAKGQPPPDFTASTFDGKTLTLSSLKGKPVLINFFASWCTSCRAEMPAIEAAYRAHKDQGFTVVGVNTLESGDGVAFYREMGVTFPAVFDPGIPGKIGKAYGVRQGLPASIFLDRSGKVELIQFGGITRGFVEQELQKLL